jgi:selenocysteine-specific elongation factor
LASSSTVSPPITSLRRVVVGTAGHIDHGKTQLIKALTGIDCDRWAEEKERGITIDLGFAHLTEGDLQVGFIDVPGHERFVHNALAGLGGIRTMLLVVAADAGVMPQTREHLAICSLLGIPSGIVALTKSDLVSPDLMELAELEILEALERTPFADARIIRVSSLTGEGLGELKRALFDLAARFVVPFDPSRPARLPIDRAFHLRGLGVVVTGTLASGILQPGDVLDLLPSGPSVRVRSIQVHGASREQAAAGERTSLQLTGAALEDLERGIQLATPGAYEAGTSLCARFTLLEDAPAPLRRGIPIRLHLYSTEVLGTLRPLAPPELKPGETGIVELRLDRPVVAIRGDRFIVRRPSPQTTLGGGLILDPRWRRRRGAGLAPALEALGAGDREALLFWVESEAERGIETETLARRLGVRSERLDRELEELAGGGSLVQVPASQGRPRRWLAASAYDRVERRARSVLKSWFQSHRMAKGIPKAEAVRRILPALPAHLIQLYLSWLQERGVLEIEGDLVTLPGRRVELSGAESKLVAAVQQRFDAAGLAPPLADQVRAELSAEPKLFDTVVRYLVQNGHLVRLPGDFLMSATSLRALREQLLAADWERFSVPQFKERFGLTRKFAIPILEHFDSAGVTRRAGDERIVTKSSLPTDSRGEIS